MALDIPARLLPVYAFEGLVLIGGLVVWWIFQFNRSAQTWRVPRLKRWDVTVHAFLVMCLQVVFGGIVGAIVMRGVSGLLPKGIRFDDIFVVMLSNLGLHLGAVIGALIAVRSPVDLLSEPSSPTINLPPPGPPLSTRQCWLAGVLTFLAAVLLIAVVSFLWQVVLSGLGIPAEKQELLDIFGKTHEPIKLAVMTFIAVILAPLAEELAFRAGLFRFLRGRVPTAMAFNAPAALFAALHLNLAVFLPLFALGLLFSVVYQRTGRILVTVIAHGLFNLNTILLVLLNVNI